MSGVCTARLAEAHVRRAEVQNRFGRYDQEMRRTPATEALAGRRQRYGKATSHVLVMLRTDAVEQMQLIEFVVGRVGFEPTTNTLKVYCSTD